MPTTQIIGDTIANTMEVDANTKAAHATLRPEDYIADSGGIYKLAGNSGIMAANIGLAAPIWSFRWGSPTKYALVKRVTLSAGNNTVAFVAGIVLFNLFIARGFTASDTGGASLVTSGSNELRTSMAASQLATNGDCRMSTTAALTAGTRAIDGDPIAAIACGVGAVAGFPMVPLTDFFDFRPGEYPLVLAQNEGLVIQVGGVQIAQTGTWKFSVKIDWTEKASYP